MQVRKAYKKFALRVHPDKAAAACRFGTDLVPGTPLVGDAPAIQVHNVAMWSHWGANTCLELGLIYHSNDRAQCLALYVCISRKL